MIPANVQVRACFRVGGCRLVSAKNARSTVKRRSNDHGGGSVGYTRKRTSADGRARYTAYYLDLHGRTCSAGTFSSRKDADKAWQNVEANFAAGRPTDPRRGRMTFRTYVDEIWFPNHVIEPSTRQSYRYNIDKHLMPMFGQMKMSMILPMHVREWVMSMSKAGVSPAAIRHAKIILSSIFTTALSDLVIALHPCKGVKGPTVAVREYRILTPEEYDVLQESLPLGAQQLVETAIESGLRWGELTELRVRDLHPTSCILTVSRGVVELQPRFHPNGERFLVKPYPKGKRSRRFKLSRPLVERLLADARAKGKEADDLLFTFDEVSGEDPVATPIASVDAIGLTEPNEQGRQYQHGTLSAYTAGRCRCVHCRGAFARYRAARRTAGKDSPRGTRKRDTDGHIPRDWFQRVIWKPACKEAGIDPPVRPHDLRHSHASWLLAGGADIQVVKERLGHRSIATTEKYLHTLPDADETALKALRRVRGRSRLRVVKPGGTARKPHTS
jgi:integrase